MSSRASQDVSPRVTRLALGGAALAGVAFQLVLVLAPLDTVVAKLTPDDLYYYLQTAWNLSRLGFPTFDGLNSTNGVQFAWFWVLTALGAVAPSKELFLRGVLLLAVALNALTFLGIARLGKALGRGTLTLFVAAGWLYLTGRYYLSGLENSLHALVFVWFLAQVATLVVRRERSEETLRALTWVSVLASLLVWIRIDTVFYTGPLFLYALWLTRSSPVKAWLWSSAPALAIPVVAGAVMAAGFHWMAGYPLPVSGLIKQGLYEWTLSTFAELSLRGFQTTNAFFDLGKLVIPGRFYQGALVAGVLATLSGLWALGRFTNYHAESGLGRFRSAFLVLLVAAFAHLLYLTRLGGYAEHGFWYQSPYFVTCIVTTAVVLDGLVTLVSTRWSLRRALLAPALFGLLALAWAGGSTFRYFVREKLREYPDIYRMQTARWMRDNLEPEAVCGSWNAGQLGFFSERRVVHMEGLVNSVAFYRWLSRRDVRELDYLRERRIAYVVDYQMPAHVREAFPLVKTIEVPYGPKKGRVFEIRRNPDWTPGDKPPDGDR
jgi:hypothetical protein